ncbi:MAG: DNA-protecting protein DprA, partial [Thiovulaceae bacterium]|nr:DNA-protecting protein DprA [Sulfurimonadaceae bacterium]
MKTLPSVPESLAQLKKPPKTLFYQGNIDLLKKRKVAIVGSRRASTYAKNMTFEIAKALKDAGLTVVSGAAMGIDAYAHKGAFPSTIAVMGNSLDLKVPAINKGLIESIEKEALVLSEYSKTTHPTRYSFVQRNRIVVGLCEAVILSEADLNSGTMRSAEYALKIGIPIYVLSHRSGESLGTQMLLESGQANLITSTDDFIKSLGFKKETVTTQDELLSFCQKQPTYEETVSLF